MIEKTSAAGRLSVAAVALFLASHTPTHALVHLEGKEAVDYVGDIKGRFTAGEYSYEILERSHRDTMNARFSDGVIFNRQGDRFLYRKRTDGYHHIVLNDPEGREEDPVTAEPHVWRPLANALRDDHPDPHVFLDDEGNEMAVIYTGKSTFLEAETTSASLLEFVLRVRGRDRGRTAGARRGGAY